MPAASSLRRRVHLPWWVIALVCGLCALAAMTPARAAPQSLTTVREAYDQLLTVYVDPLRPADLLTDAWTGAAAAATAAGMDGLPTLGVLPDDREGAWSGFAAAFEALARAGDGRISGTDLAYAAAAAMAAGRQECHTYFMRPESFARFRAQLAGRMEISGIGIQVSPTLPYTVINVFPDTPAARAGLMPGDVIVAVDGVAAGERGWSALNSRIRGEAGTTVRLTVAREPGAEPLDLTITRASLIIPVVTAVLRDDGVAVIALNSFTSDATAERMLRDALRDLDARGATGWVLDLRANPGGGVQSVVAVLSLLLPPDTPVLSLQTREQRTDRLATAGEPLATQRPLAVLVGPVSMSGAEIVAAVLQDTGRARLFGSRTAGCANVGTLSPFSDGSGMVITSSRLLAGPRERPLDGRGVTPDMEVAPAAGDPVLQAAIDWILNRTGAPAPDPVAIAP